MRTLVIGCNHRTAPVEVREKIALEEAAVPWALRLLTGKYQDCEAVILSTCNRVELYVARPVGRPPGIAEVIAFLGEIRGVDPAEFTRYLYTFEDTEAVRHLFRVAGSLDSMVIGESQILAQTRKAFDTAKAESTVGPRLEALFQRALAVAKELHTQTEIASGRVSVGSTAVDLARQIFARFDDKQVLMVGAGEMGELTLKHLLTTRPHKLLVTSRTQERAEDTARRVRGDHELAVDVVPYSRWIERLAEVDIVISCTGASDPILTAEQFKPIPAGRRYRPILLIDIAVPRDIDPAVGDEECVFLYNIDDLQAVTESNLAKRRASMDRCQAILEGHVVEFVERQARRDVGPLIAALRERFQAVGQAELERIAPKLESTSPHDRELIEEMLHRVTQKLLHEPVTRLNELADNGAKQVLADTLRGLFNLDDEQRQG